jgi:hypothetical protein
LEKGKKLNKWQLLPCEGWTPNSDLFNDTKGCEILGEQMTEEYLFKKNLIKNIRTNKLNCENNGNNWN